LVDHRSLAEVTRALIEGRLDAARQIADYMTAENIAGWERARLLVDVAAEQCSEANDHQAQS
jgi:hypothetical protein